MLCVFYIVLRVLLVLHSEITCDSSVIDNAVIIDELTDFEDETKAKINYIGSVFTDLKRENKDDIASLKSELEILKSIVNASSATYAENIQMFSTHLLELKDEIKQQRIKIENSIVPIGFVYTQLPSQSSPKNIWSQFTWTEISSGYSGVFFRVEGGEASAFGSIQQENAPRIDYISFSSSAGTSNSVTLPKQGMSSFVTTGGNYYSRWVGAQFRSTGGEVRPINMAIKLWKRTA